MSSDTQPAMTYPTTEQYERWKDRAAEFDMSVSEFMQAMVKAGLKKFDAAVDPDETNQELRQQRNDLKDELARTRGRIRTLEDRLHDDERNTVHQYVENNPGATYDEIIQHVIDTVPERVSDHLDELEGESLTTDDGAYYATDDDASDGGG